MHRLFAFSDAHQATPPSDFQAQANVSTPPDWRRFVPPPPPPLLPPSYLPPPPPYPYPFVSSYDNKNGFTMNEIPNIKEEQEPEEVKVKVELIEKDTHSSPHKHDFPILTSLLTQGPSMPTMDGTSGPSMPTMDGTSNEILPFGIRAIDSNKKYTDQDLLEARKCIMDLKQSVTYVSGKYSIPQRTLYKRKQEWITQDEEKAGRSYEDRLENATQDLKRGVSVTAVSKKYRFTSSFLYSLKRKLYPGRYDK